MNTDTMRFHTSRRYPLQENSKHPPNILVKHKPASTESVENIPSHLLQWSQSGSLHPPIIKPNINPSYMPFTHYQLVKHIHPQAPCKKNSTKECSLCIQIEAYHPTCQASCASADGRSSSQESAHCLHPLQLLSPPPVDLETQVVKDPQAAT